MRGWLNDDHGVALKDIHWFQAGTNEAGRIEKVELSLPKGVKLTRVPDKSLSDMLAAGEIDCAIIARPPDCFRQGHKDVVRLYPDFWAMEENYYKSAKVWPIMGQNAAMAVEHFKRIADASDLPLIAFQYPLATGQGYPNETILRMIEDIPTLKAIKDWAGTPQQHGSGIRAAA